MSERRSLLRVFFVLAAFGLANGFVMLGKPILHDIRAVDVVQLVGTGMCFGGAIVALAFHFRGPRVGQR
ncbi:MAG TPA: hypothetical protein VFQ51_09445 [Vicinamibacteria bacterium]|nr:hypothetical protein [Vicinamibacteria bacterium]